MFRGKVHVELLRLSMSASMCLVQRYPAIRLEVLSNRVSIVLLNCAYICGFFCFVLGGGFALSCFVIWFYLSSLDMWLNHDSLLDCDLESGYVPVMMMIMTMMMTKKNT